MESRARRFAENESLFRELNDRIDDTSERFFLGGEMAQKFVCECGHAGCTDWVTLTLDEYHVVREHPRRFFVTPGHEDAEVEEVVEQHERFTVVEKIGEAARIAEERAAKLAR